MERICDHWAFLLQFTFLIGLLGKFIYKKLGKTLGMYENWFKPNRKSKQFIGNRRKLCFGMNPYLRTCLSIWDEFLIFLQINLAIGHCHSTASSRSKEHLLPATKFTEMFKSEFPKRSEFFENCIIWRHLDLFKFNLAKCFKIG